MHDCERSRKRSFELMWFLSFIGGRMLSCNSNSVAIPILASVLTIILPESLTAQEGADAGRVHLVTSAKDESAGGLDCCPIETQKAVYYLENFGAGLFSMIDRDGNDGLFIESTNHEAIGKRIAAVATGIPQQAENTLGNDKTDISAKRKALERFALTRKGDAKIGHRLFFNDDRTKCSVCHRVDKAGGTVGPDLSKIGGKYDRPHLVESLLAPSQQIVEGYRTSLIITTDGKVHSGILKDRDNATITIIDSMNKLYRLETANIEEQTEAKIRGGQSRRRRSELRLANHRPWPDRS